ncbi:MAG: hypothetical protein KGK07_07440 [Chloroflexota bacterium]|nr:hypothetical protein [Chloroflexota bacterium]
MAAAAATKPRKRSRRTTADAPARGSAKGTAAAKVTGRHEIANLTPEQRSAWMSALGSLGGAPTSLTPAVAQQIVEAVRIGVPMTAAAWSAGVSDSAVSDWRGRGEADRANGVETIYSRFVEALKGSEGFAITRCVTQLQTVQGDWQRWAWMLERRWPEWFGRRDALAVSMQGDVRITVAFDANWHSRDVIDVTPAAQGETQKRGRKPRELDGQPGG